MSNQNRQHRENVPRVFPKTPRWSPWYTAIVPKAPKKSEKYESREKGNAGAIYSDISTQFLERGYDNGIYELGVSKGGTPHVQAVYIGSAHRDGPGSIDKRIGEYCRDGSHKSALINRAMRLGYTLSVRAKSISGKKEDVWEYEDRYLEKYDYAWNERNNGRIRWDVPSP